MILTADTINGVMSILDTDEIGGREFYEIVSNEEFYESLNTITDNDLILVTCSVSLSLAKKIHKEYGITRL